MNFPKINMYLLIVVIILLAAALYFLFINKKDTTAQSELLMQMAKKMGAEGVEKIIKTESDKAELPIKEDESPVPTDEDWKNIYAISEKLYFKKTAYCC